MNRLLLIANYDYINTALSLSGIEDEVKTIKDKYELEIHNFTGVYRTS